jgi:hypothetical protein
LGRGPGDVGAVHLVDELDRAGPLLGRAPEFATLKGRSNYLCLHRLHEGVPSDDEDGLFDQFEAVAQSGGGPSSRLGKDLLRLRDWADETETGDRDAMTPGVSDRAWSQVAVSSRECLGASRCAYGAECFAEAARERAKLAEVIVTNHALLAIDALEGAPVLPAHEVLIVDEAHELVSRVTGVATGELTPGGVSRAVRRSARLVDEKAADALQSAGESFERLMELALPGRLEELPEDLGYALAALRDAARTVITALGNTRDASVADEDAVRKQAMAAIENVHQGAERLLERSEYDVLWYERHDRYGASLRVVSLQDWDRDAVEVSQHNAQVDKDATFKSIVITLGGDVVRLSPKVAYKGRGGNAELHGLYFTGDDQHHEHRSLIDHNISNTRSRVEYKGALSGKGAHGVWIGDVIIGEGTTGTDSYEHNRNLQLTDDTRVDSVPNLEIFTGEVEGAGHAAASGRLDDIHLFYLRSRGIPEDEARRLVIRGYFLELINRIPVEGLAEEIMAKVERKLAAHE